MATHTELADLVDYVRTQKEELSTAEQFSLKLVAAHLENDTPLKKAQAVKALADTHHAEYDEAINMYLSALNNQYMDGKYSENDAKIMNSVVVNIVRNLVFHEHALEQKQLEH